MTIGCDRNDAGVTIGWFDGFILDFTLCTGKYDGDWNIHGNYGCESGTDCGKCYFN
jgi:hypothetical protein